MGRRLGQHFLTRKSILDRIASAAYGDETSLVVEIGPGKGTLTESLLERARKVIAIEVDPVLVHYLRQKFQDAIDAERLVLVEGDVLKTDLGAWGPAALRRALLFLRRGAMRRELPDDTQWFEVKFTSEDLARVRFFPRAQWRRVAERMVIQ